MTMFAFKRSSAPSSEPFSKDIPSKPTKNGKKRTNNKKSSLSSSTTTGSSTTKHGVGTTDGRNRIKTGGGSSRNDGSKNGVSFQPPLNPAKASSSNKSRGGIGKLFKKKPQSESSQRTPAVVTRFELPDAGSRPTSNSFFDDVSVDASLYTTISKATVDYRRPSRQRSSHLDDDEASNYSEIRHQVVQMRARQTGGLAIREERYDDVEDEDDEEDGFGLVAAAAASGRNSSSGKFPVKAPPRIITRDHSLQDADQSLLSPPVLTPATLPEDEDYMSCSTRSFFSGTGFNDGRVMVRKIVEESDTEDNDEYSYGTYLSEPAQVVQQSDKGPVDLDDSDVSTSSSASSSGCDDGDNNNPDQSILSKLPTERATHGATMQLSMQLPEESRILSDEELFDEADTTLQSQSQHVVLNRSSNAPVDLDRTPTPSECSDSDSDSDSKGELESTSTLEPPPAATLNGSTPDEDTDSDNGSNASGYMHNVSSEYDNYDMSQNFGESFFSHHNYQIKPNRKSSQFKPAEDQSMMSMSMNESVMSMPVDLDAPPVDLDEEEDKLKVRRQAAPASSQLDRSIMSMHSNAASTIVSLPVDLDNPPVDLDDSPAKETNESKATNKDRAEPTTSMDHSRSISSRSGIRPSVVRSVVKNTLHPWQKSLPRGRQMLIRQGIAEEPENEQSMTISFDSSRNDDDVDEELSMGSNGVSPPYPARNQTKLTNLCEDENSHSSNRSVSQNKKSSAFETPTKSSISGQSRFVSSPENDVTKQPRSFLNDSNPGNTSHCSSSFTSSPPRTRTIWTPKSNDKRLKQFDYPRNDCYGEEDVDGIPPILAKISDGGTTNSSNTNSYVYGGNYDSSHPLEEKLDDNDKGFHTSFLQSWPIQENPTFLNSGEIQSSFAVDESTFDLGNSRLELAANCFSSLLKADERSASDFAGGTSQLFPKGDSLTTEELDDNIDQRRHFDIFKLNQEDGSFPTKSIEFLPSTAKRSFEAKEGFGNLSTILIDRRIGTIDEATQLGSDDKFDVDAMQTFVTEDYEESALVQSFINSSGTSDDSEESSGAVLLTNDELEKHYRKMIKRAPSMPDEKQLPPGYASWKFEKDEDERKMDVLMQQQAQAEKILQERKARSDAGLPVSKASSLTASMLESCHEQSLGSSTYKVYGDPNKEDSFSLTQLSTLDHLHLVDLIIPEFIDPMLSRRGESQLTLNLDTKRLAKELLKTERRKQKQAEDKAIHDAEAEADRIERLRERGLAQRRQLELEPSLQQVASKDSDESEALSMNSRHSRGSASHQSLGRKLRHIDSKQIKCNSTDESVSVMSMSHVSKKSGASLEPCCVCHSGERTHISMPCMHFSFCADCVAHFHKQQAIEEDFKCVCPLCDTVGIVFSQVNLG